METDFADEFETFKEEVTIVVHGQDYLTWIPGRRSLATAPGEAREIALFIDTYIEAKSNGSPTIMVTPSGPSLPASVSSLHTVVWAFLSTYGPDEVKFIGPTPSLRDMGLDDPKTIH